MEKLRYGIIGFGAQGGAYANFLAAGSVAKGTLGAICDTDPSKKAAALEKYPDVPFFDSYIEMMESGKVDAIITCVPHYLHPEMGIEALKRDIHALLEKPAGVYTKQVRELNAYALTKPDVAFGIMFNQRMNPLYQKIKEVVASGDIGDIRRTNWIITTWWRPQGYYNQSAWRATWGGEGGGVLVNQAPHQLDLWQWICGMPVKVYSKCKFGFRRDIATEDEVTALVEYENGATGVFVTCTHDIMGTDRLEILGEKGKIVVEGSKKITIKRLKTPEREMSENMDMSDVMRIFMGGSMADVYDEEVIEIPDQWGTQHCLVMDNFADHVLNGTPLVASGQEGIKGVTLANAIHLSTWLGKEIELPFDEDLFLSELNKRVEEEKQCIPEKKSV